jgi:hypothetical protein
MPGVPRKLAEHRIDLNFTPDKKAAIKKEITKFLGAGFIRGILHPDWLANRKKGSNEWCMCVDYTDLNKHCALRSFLDCYSGYHPIALRIEDQSKTSFITPFGVYYYMTMSFGLKNTGATYQCAIQAYLNE